MMDFFVPGNPVALKRHRQGKWGNYDPSSGDKADFLAKAMQHKPDKPFDCPLSLTLFFIFPRPKNHFGTGKKANVLKDSAPVWHTGRPDLDNLEKFICDALNGVFWRDDSIICQKFSEKSYSDERGIIGVQIGIKTL